MADPFSIIAGVLSIATVVVQSSQALSVLINNVKSAPGEIKAVAQDVHAFRSVVSSLKVTLEQTGAQDVVSTDPALVETLANLLPPLNNCEQALQNLMLKLQRGPGFTGGSTFRATALHLKWGISTRREVKNLQLRLEATKSTLSAALEAVTMYVLCPSTSPF